MPRPPALAGAGMRGIEEPAPLADDAARGALALGTAPPAAFADDTDRPGATADTSAANPAVSTAAPAITQRRVRLTRATAASRISTARDRSLLNGWSSMLGQRINAQ
jgi:hypothetical protein